MGARPIGSGTLALVVSALFAALVAALWFVDLSRAFLPPAAAWALGLTLIGVYAAFTGYLSFRLGRGASELLELAPRLLESVTVGLVVTDAEYRIAYANPAFAAMVGRTRRELDGAAVEGLIYPPDLPTFDREAARRRRGHADAYRLRLVDEGGEPVHVAISSTPFIDRGRFDGAVAFVTDITATVAAREDAHHARNVSGFLFDALTHDLSNSLQGVVGRVEIAAASGSQGDEPGRRALHSAVASAKAMARLVREAKLLASAERERWPLKSSTLTSFLADALGRADLAPLTFIRAELPAELASLRIEANALAPLALAKLLEEAAASAPRSEAPVPIEVRASCGELGPSSVVFSVSGYRTLAPVEEINEVLRPPSSSDHAEPQWRSGIRLVLAAAVASAHGWTLFATRAPGQACATLELRISTAPAPAKAQREALPAGRGRAPRSA